ncbi:hypothetical protein [Streptomyces nodosus]|uniref:hypothetical protein n=1 Tax=Streptomyces nodosus TaxID=40318 RepID=UPI003805CCB0
MTHHRHRQRGGKAGPIPRDMPDQQARTGQDPWDARRHTGDEADTDVPDTDEAGTGRKGAPRSGAVHPEHPVPDEPPA